MYYFTFQKLSIFWNAWSRNILGSFKPFWKNIVTVNNSFASVDKWLITKLIHSQVIIFLITANIALIVYILSFHSNQQIQSVESEWHQVRPTFIIGTRKGFFIHLREQFFWNPVDLYNLIYCDKLKIRIVLHNWFLDALL